ncbi:ATP synthase subunit I [Verminephrobacter aporrectodeae]|uniref:ATP synthase subunit I n=1 Tax=Verminephrobacter aporrectodeae subsp. tuberculatae TaxID=1110392 RepID=A0ABT3KUZ9_9BURK|nr:ATP synthase subunit I [Verminephrobacter aporrectodeae]MCW5256771.1 ATP synthase subunit I [Verminephrobacter aporrectodeae subsp. tuberculatae]MCW5322061.1 ATP synthase subunit I [Verminephrobacter aporrectodeae subsp. tuberculatae]MCW8166349.1 ATP synthase subunit I [Verminephrobacter aporrectodeae subsp. tuberculatae]MCW8170224.1 ATP synthase subunit I [Verminephrobacter aporrectodeae subsp. tuberculatae]MCW8174196.1 ATP synthase subunit I [Verminephrobacter aporrectodeae subsp. tubercu
MKTFAPETEEESGCKALNAQEAGQWRKRNPPVSVWQIVAGQAVAALLVALAAWVLTGNAALGWSAAYGAFAVVAPAALLAYAMARHKASVHPRAAWAGFFGGEIAKIAFTVALLAAAPRLVAGLHWVALLVGMLVAMKTYWVALWVRPGVRKTV